MRGEGAEGEEKDGEIGKDRVKRYLELARGLSEKITEGVLALYERALSTNQQVIEREAEVSLSIPLADGLLSRFGGDGIESISFDKGFCKRENKELLKSYIPEVIMPKKGKKNQAEEAEESSKIFKKLRHKHSAVESDINRLEHHGLDRCLDKGLKAFKRYCALGVIAANLHKLGNVLQEKARKKEKKLRKAA